MAKINTGRMFLAGLSAGLVANVGEIILNVFILAEDWELANVEAGLPASEGAGMIFWYIVPGFLLGITGVWIYAGPSDHGKEPGPGRLCLPDPRSGS